MDKYGLMISYNRCDCCQKCEAACRQAHGYPVQQSGILVKKVGPLGFASGKMHINYIATPTDFCDHCGGRLEAGQGAACAGACPNECIAFGEIQELGKKMTERNMVLFSLR